MKTKENLNTCKEKLFVLLLTLTIFFLSLSDSVFAVNLVQNPNINGNLNNWNAGISTYDPALDATGVPGSGSAQHIINWAGSGIVGQSAMSQCFTTFVPGKAYTFGGKVFIPSSQTRMGTGSVLISWFTGNDCSTGLISYHDVYVTFFDPTGAWRSLDSLAVVAPLTAQSVWFSVGHGIDDTGTHQTNFDDLYLDDSPTISGTITYTGNHTSENLVVTAFDGPACGEGNNYGAPVFRFQALSSYNYTISGLPVPGTYVICAYIDLNNSSGSPEPGEPSGQYAGTVSLTVGVPDQTGINFSLSDPATAVPSMTEWGMITFMVLAGLSSAYCLRRQRRTKS